eukprot:scaffold1416_cov90-Cylindrotheca_fusiformis.AAC.3
MIPSDLETIDSSGERVDVSSTGQIISQSASVVDEDNRSPSSSGVCGCLRFNGIQKAQGYCLVGIGNGSIAASNVFLSTAFIYLASKEAGCIDEKGAITACDQRVHGFLPSTFVTYIATIAGLLVAFSLPVIGAIIDHSHHRQTVGRLVAFFIWLIQTLQIFTTERTWFYMAILQAIVAALYEFHYALAVSYLPDVARYEVSHDTMADFNRWFFCLQYLGQATWLAICMGIGSSLNFNDSESAHLGQSISSFVLLICYTQGWRKLPPIAERRKFPERRSFLLEGFRQNFRTLQSIRQNPNKTLKWFFATVSISKAGGYSLLSIMISYFTRVMKFGWLDAGLAFLLGVTFAGPGATCNSFLARKTNPKRSLQINFLFSFLVTLTAPFVLNFDAAKAIGQVWACLWGFSLGWLASGQQLFFTLCIPASQETELAGFFVYCGYVLVWLPPLIYSTIVEHGGKEQYGLASLCILQVVSMITILMVPEWKDVVEGSKHELVEMNNASSQTAGLSEDEEMRLAVPKEHEAGAATKPVKASLPDAVGTTFIPDGEQ